ncbi:MAG: preprotein translocase subunit SecG [Bacteroidales bacterium OttesenSCG-928-I14]|jgi:preprotein translocase subunit SecG|nr:preprotein translocase subunit SecG [Bacteroidales bacterium OttesenSCG-928-I14]
MYTLVTIFTVIISVLLILIVIVQNPKGGRMASGFSFTNQVMGVRKSVDFFERITWYLATILVVLCIFASVLFIPRKKNLLEDISSVEGGDFTENTTQQNGQNES